MSEEPKPNTSRENFLESALAAAFKQVDDFRKDCQGIQLAYHLAKLTEQQQAARIAELEQERSEVANYLWPEQTGLPNIHRNILLAVETRERLLRNQAESHAAEVAKEKARYDVNGVHEEYHRGRAHERDESAAEIERLNGEIRELTNACNAHYRTVVELEARYTGNRTDCGHLKNLTSGAGTVGEECQACRADKLQAAAKQMAAALEAHCEHPSWHPVATGAFKALATFNALQ